ncbi:hypothetical protein predicted by Glimmer/Critica [Bordetella petrii]|uniref:Uncharacterized protein n=1 Tax=Bordetella petrii (strain ATCC BAA-461 / DSM 12804 / CCUG 43448 / CIP 107267 / Se-1111R) TaxID=340100 RepID=A9IF74_BORPD|nr:hypothetical protein predicted by Glimmer/Critica [Bordetella petrii]
MKAFILQLSGKTCRDVIDTAGFEGRLVTAKAGFIRTSVDRANRYVGLGLKFGRSPFQFE